MRKLNLLLIVVMVGFILESCSKGGSGGGTVTPPPASGKLTLTASKNTITADGFEETVFTVKDQSGNDVTGSCSFYVNNISHPRTTYWTGTAGTYKVKAQKGSLTSAEITITATAPGPSPFSQKLLVEDYTGTWCGHCPRVGIKLEEYTSSHPGTIVIGNHGPNGSSDPFTFSSHNLMADTYSVNGYPNAVVNRDYIWNENNNELNQELSERAPLGLAFQTAINSNIINITSKVKFDVTTSIDMKLVVYLVEDGIVYPQVNYNYFGLPNPITDYTHNGILRRNATDLFGDLVDKTKQQKGSIYEKSASINVNGLGYNINNLRVIAFVVYGSNNYLGKKGIANVQCVKVGENKDFD